MKGTKIWHIFKSAADLPRVLQIEIAKAAAGTTSHWCLANIPLSSSRQDTSYQLLELVGKGLWQNPQSVVCLYQINVLQLTPKCCSVLLWYQYLTCASKHPFWSGQLILSTTPRMLCLIFWSTFLSPTSLASLSSSSGIRTCSGRIISVKFLCHSKTGLWIGTVVRIGSLVLTNQGTM